MRLLIVCLCLTMAVSVSGMPVESSQPVEVVQVEHSGGAEAVQEWRQIDYVLMIGLCVVLFGW